MKNKSNVKWLVTVALLLVGSFAATSFSTIWYCTVCEDTWDAEPDYPGETCRAWEGLKYLEHAYKWDYTTTSEEGDPYNGTLKAWDDVRCKEYEGVDPYTCTYKTVSNSGTVKSVSHTWDADLKWSPVKDVLELSAGCSTTRSSSWHCDEGCAWEQPVTGTFEDGEYTKMYPKWINTTITNSGPLECVRYCAIHPGPNWGVCNLHGSHSLGTKTATKVERAVSATFHEVKVCAKCKCCNVADMWCNGSDCDTTDCAHNAPEE